QASRLHCGLDVPSAAVVSHPTNGGKRRVLRSEAGAVRTDRVMVAVLGPTTVEGTTVTDRQRALLAALGLHGDGADTPTLVDAVWGGTAPRSARQSLQNQVSRLRNRWGAGLIVTEGTTYRLRADTDVDEVSAVARRW